jgi:hypothetical protein
MKRFVDYFNALKKDYEFTIKIAVNDLAEEQVGHIEEALKKYDLKNVSSVKKTPIQQSPLDFPNVRDSEVHIFNVTLQYPVTPDALLREVAEVGGIPMNAVAIYTANDPRHQYTKDVLEDNTGKPTALGNPEKWTTEPAYGEAYNSAFLKSLETVKKEREENIVTNDLIPAQKIDKDTVAGEEKGKPGTDSPLKDMWRTAAENSPKKGKNTMMSTPAKETK